MRLKALATASLVLTLALLGCSDFPHEFEVEPMIIYSIRIHDVGSTSAILEWKTNKLANSEVYYKTAGGFEKIIKAADEVIDHVVTLTELAPRTQYFLVLRSSGGDPVQEAHIEGLAFTTAE